MAENLKGCSVCCKSSWNQLQDLCRLAKLSCPALGVSKKNLYDFEVEYLCDYKKIRIITSEEAERRGQIYDRQGATYLFDLDYVEDVYTVDAAYYGNISHFVNHSCDPNLQVYNVFIDNLDERLPRIAFFATRTIWAGEELTFDYNMQVDPVDMESTRMDSNFGLAGLPGSPKKRVRIECKCGTTACRKYLFITLMV